MLADFMAYCEANPSMRFWQALRNWSGYSFILAVPVGSELDYDTFYWEGKNHLPDIQD